jgi:CRISPR-associated protein Csd1
MSWIEKLCQTYDNCFDHIGKSDDRTPLLPICHTTQNAQIEVVIDEGGAFKSARVISTKNAKTIIPCTEKSGIRTGKKPVCHPLCDKLQYVAGDFLTFGGDVTSGFAKNPEEPFKMYLECLSKWCASVHRHPKVETVYRYVSKGSLISDLCSAAILPLDPSTGLLKKKWDGPSSEYPEIFTAMKASGALPEDAFVRWAVEIPDDSQTKLWEDENVQKSWIKYYAASEAPSEGICYVTGKSSQLARKHPAKLRNSGDKAKLISSNDTSGFTYRGRFIDATQACGVGFEVSQKAHNALRWLIARQGYTDGSLAIVSWAISGKEIPDLLANSSLFSDEESASFTNASGGYTAQAFALRLRSKIRGYNSELGDSTGIVIMAMDSVKKTKGRMSLLYYRELSSSEFLSRLEAWHTQCCWHQTYDCKTKFVGAPAPRDIAEAAYGRSINEKLKSAIIRQLLSCIIDGVSLPSNLFQACFRRVCNKESFKNKGEWEKALGIACALYKYTNNKRNYQMSLEKDRVTRDYLYGRLLALAERLEEIALQLGNEKRPTNAARLMQRFADHPYSTWKTIELQLQPYKNRLKSRRGGFLHNIEAEFDSVMASFKSEEFTSPKELSGEFLLGYHCQRGMLKSKPGLADSQECIEETNNLT